MKVKDFDDNIHNWPPKPKNYIVQNNDMRQKSSYHLKCRDLLDEMFPTYTVMEEVPLAGTRLRADFYIPQLKLVVEVHGEEHYKFNKFFHGSSAGWRKSLINDRRKIEWCHMNNIRHVELPYCETVLEWKERLNERK